jgi:hypothetical protein
MKYYKKREYILDLLKNYIKLAEIKSTEGNFALLDKLEDEKYKKLPYYNYIYKFANLEEINDDNIETKLLKYIFYYYRSFIIENKDYKTYLDNIYNIINEYIELSDIDKFIIKKMI